MKSTRSFATLILFIMVAVAFAVAADSTTKLNPEGVQITNLTSKLRIEINGQLFSEYLFKEVPRPCFYPLIGPDGKAMTRNWPLKGTPNESHDHKHHRSLWFAHYSVNGQDT